MPNCNKYSYTSMKKMFRYVLLVFVFLMLVACGKPDSQKAFEKNFKQTIADVSKKMKDGNEVSKMLAGILEKGSYKVNKVNEEKNMAELDVTIKSADFVKYMTEYLVALKPLFDSNMGEEAFQKKSLEYFENLTKKELDYTETDVTVHMEKVDGEWKVINTEDVLTAIFGGLTDAAADFN